MPMRWVYILLICFALPSAATAAGAPRVSLDRLLPHIRNHIPGTLYDVVGPYRNRDGALRYRLKWMTPSGEILWIVVDGRNGDILRILARVNPSQDYDNRDAPYSHPHPEEDHGYDDGPDRHGPPRGGPGPRG